MHTRFRFVFSGGDDPRVIPYGVSKSNAEKLLLDIWLCMDMGVLIEVKETL